MVSRIFRYPLIVILLSLALLGIGVQLFTSPGAFFTSLFVTIGVVTVIILLFRTFIMPRLMNRQAGVPKQYKSAAKATQHKSQPNTGTAPKKKPAAVKKQKQPEKKKSSSKPLAKRSPEVQLTVIEGKKNKKKSRANS